MSITATYARKHLREINKQLRKELIPKISQMKADEARNMFNKLFMLENNFYRPKKPLDKLIEGQWNLKAFQELSKKKDKKPAPKKPAPKKPEPKKPEPKKPEPKKPAPKKPEPKKPEPKKPEPIKKEPVKIPETKQPEPKKEEFLKAVVQKVKPGDPRFVKNFQKLSPRGQLQAMAKQIKITGSPPPDSYYKKNAQFFYDNILDVFNQSVTRAIPTAINKFQLSLKDLEAFYIGQTKDEKIDFYPTPTKCVVELVKKMPKMYTNYLKELEENILEGTAGIGSVAYALSLLFPKSRITSNELNPDLYDIMDKYLPSKIIRSNENFFDLNINKKYDIFFLNPPFENKIYFKFLCYALKWMNNLKNKFNRSSYLLFISPEMRRKDLSIYFEGLFTIDGGQLPLTMIKYINEIENTDFKIKEFKNALEYETKTEREEELRDIIDEHYSFSYGGVVGECTGFGGTGTKAYLQHYQMI